MIKFPFDERKATQAALFILGESRSPRHHLGIYLFGKMLYVAERMSLLKRGVPIFGDDLFSYPKGPLVDRIYTIIKGHNVPEYWRERIVKNDDDMEPAYPRAVEETWLLSESEMDFLRAASQLIWNWNSTKSVQTNSENLTEWENVTKLGIRKKAIDPATIFREGGWDEQSISEIAALAEEGLRLGGNP